MRNGLLFNDRVMRYRLGPAAIYGFPWEWILAGVLLLVAGVSAMFIFANATAVIVGLLTAILGFLALYYIALDYTRATLFVTRRWLILTRSRGLPIAVSFRRLDRMRRVLVDFNTDPPESPPPEAHENSEPPDSVAAEIVIHTCQPVYFAIDFWADDALLIETFDKPAHVLEFARNFAQTCVQQRKLGYDEPRAGQAIPVFIDKSFDDEQDAALDDSPITSDATVARDGDVLTITLPPRLMKISTRKVPGWLVFVLSAFALGMVVTLSYVGLRVGWRLAWAAVAGELILFCLTWWGVSRWLGRAPTLVDVTPDAVLITQPGLFKIRQNSWPALLVEHFDAHGDTENDTTPKLRVQLFTGEAQAFLSERDPAELDWLAARLNKELQRLQGGKTQRRQAFRSWLSAD